MRHCIGVADAALAALARRGDDLRRVVDRDAVDRDDPVARLQARRRAGAAGLDVAEHRLAPRVAEADASASSWRRRRRRRASTSARCDAPLAAAVAPADEQVDVLAVQHRLRHLPAQVGERADVVPFAAVLRPGANPVAGAHAGLLGDARRRRRAEHRLRLVDADPVRRRVQRDREREVGDRPGGDDRGALPERLAVEGAVELGRRRRRLRARRACARSRRTAARRRRTRCRRAAAGDARGRGRSRPRSAAP